MIIIKLGEAYVEIYADQTKLTAGLEKAQKNTAASMKAIGKSMTIAGAAIVAGFGMAIRTAAKFEKSMALTASVASATSEELKELSDYARKMGEQSVFSASQAADGMYYLASAGMEVNEIMGALEGTLALAAATQADLAFTSESVAAAISQFALDASEATRVANVYAAAISSSQATMEKLTTSMSYVGPMAHSMGMTIEDTTGILMGLYNAGIPASMAGTALRMAFVKLIEPTLKGTTALKGLKVSVVDSSGAMRPFKDIIDDLGEAGMTTADAMAIFGIRSGPAMMALVSQGTGAIQENVDAVTGSNKAYEMAAMQIDTFEGAMKLLRSAFEEFQITLVQDLMPSLKGMIEKITEGIKKVSDWMKENPKLTETIVKVTAGIGALMLVLGPLLIILPSLVKGFAIFKAAIIAVKVALWALSMNPIVLALTALGIAVWSLYKMWQENFGGIRDFTDKVIEKMQPALDWLAKRLELIKEVVKTLGLELGITTTALAGGGGAVGAFGDEVDELGEKVKESTKTFKYFLEGFERIAEISKLLQPAREAIQKIIDTMTPYEKQLAAINERYDEAIEKIKTYITNEDDLKVAIDELNEGRKAEITLLDRQKTVYDKLVEIQKTAKNIMAGIVDKIFEFTRTPYEVKLRNINKEYDGYIEKIKEAKYEIGEEKEKIDEINHTRGLAIQNLNAEVDATKGLSLEMQTLTAQYELSNQTTEDTIKYYEDMLEAAKDIVEIKKAEMDALEEGTPKWEEAYLTYLKAQKVVKDLKEATAELTGVEKEHVSTMEEVARVTKAVEDRWFELTRLPYEVKIKEINERYDDYIKVIEESTLSDLAKETAIRNMNLARNEEIEVIDKVIEAEKELATKEVTDRILEMTDATAYSIQKIDELAETWRLAGVDAELIAEAVRLLKEELEEPPDIDPWEEFFDSLKDEVGDLTSIFQKAIKTIWDGFSDAIGDAITSFLTMAETNAEILEDMAEAEADYFDELADLQKDYAKIVSDINKKMAKEKEDYYDDLIALELSYERKVSDGIKDLTRENEDYDIDMRRLKEKRDEAAMNGDAKRAKYYQEKMDDCTLAHKRAVEDMEEKQAELVEDHKIKLDEMEEDHKEAMDALITKKDEEAQNAKDEIKEVKDKYEELMAKMEEEMVTVGGISDTFWDTMKTAGVSALSALITQLIQYVALWLISLGPVGWAILLGAVAVGAIWLQYSKAVGGEIEKLFKGGGIKGYQVGGGTDTVPAMLTPGEYVISKPMVDFIKRTGAVTSDLVSAIGSGARTPVPAFVAGGSVSNPISSTYNQQRSYSVNIQPGAIIINTPRFGEDDAQEMFRLIERQAKYRGLVFGRV